MVKAVDASICERLDLIADPAAGWEGVIAIDSTALGPAAGGCRFWHYPDREAMLTDAMRLARGMTYKNALAGLPFGGGKAVLRRPAGAFDRRALFRAFAEAVDALKGEYITAEDVGTSVADMELIAQTTSYVAGLEAKPGKAGGDPSPWTALGIFKSMQAAAAVALDSDLRGMRVAVQGAGNVGSRLCGLLHDAGARLIVADVNPERALQVASWFGGTAVPAGRIMRVEADIFAPCALGAVVNEKTIPHLRAKLICGGANNQLATERDGFALLDHGIAYAPDYVVNAGGIINVAAEYLGESAGKVEQRLEVVADRVAEIMSRSQRERRPSHLIADEMAQSVILSGQHWAVRAAALQAEAADPAISASLARRLVESTTERRGSDL